MAQDRIEFDMTENTPRTASVKVFGPTVPATTDELVAAANEIPSFHAATVKTARLIIKNAYLVTSTDNSMHFDAVGGFILAVIDSLGWSRETTIVVEKMFDRSTREWSLGADNGGSVDWTLKQAK